MFSDAEFRRLYKEAKGWVLTSKQLPPKRRSWKCDLFAYRKETIELLFQRVMQAVGIKRCVAKGTGKNAAFILAGVWLYQSCWLQNYRAGKPAAVIKEQIDLPNMIYAQASTTCLITGAHYSCQSEVMLPFCSA